MNIALFGFGKTGALVEQLVNASGDHRISFIVRYGNRSEIHRVNKQNTDVVIDFTNADAVLHNVDYCLTHQLPMVIGTTGWYSKLHEVENDCLNRHGSIVWGGNFSIGVNLFFELNKYAVELLKQFKYEPSITEVHHVQKKDAPSGTAQVLANHTAAGLHRSIDSIPIASERVGDVVGKHTVRYTTANDVISLDHEALNRRGFAEGALRAAAWICERRGFYNFADVFKQL
jgi:4-hydroxy-tetrahydrodipicolinate reductase